jgi:molecular chaperone Hsp33
MKESDTIQRFIFEHADIRGGIVHLNQTYQTIINQFDYPKAIQNLIGCACIAAVLLSDSIKFKGQLSLQFKGNEDIPLLIIKCDNTFNIRALAKFNPDASDKAFQKAFKEGVLAITIEQDNQVNAYQSIVPIIGDSLSDSLEHFFAQSEQISTKVFLSTSNSQACGMLLQLMPGEDGEKREEFWQYAIKIGETISQEELETLDNQTVLFRLYHETQLRLFDAKHIQFKCTCNKDKMLQIIYTLGQKDAKQLLKEQGAIRINCDFCHTHYEFDAIDIALIFKNTSL